MQQIIQERNLKIVELYIEGKTMRELGELFKITYQRIQQIIAKELTPEQLFLIKEQLGRTGAKVEFICLNCKRSFQIWHWQKNRKYCGRDCASDAQRKYYTLEEKRAYYRKRTKEYREKNYDRVRTWEREYVKKNRVRINAYEREYQKRNNDKVRRAQREYYAKNREKLLKYSHERYLRSKNNE